MISGDQVLGKVKLEFQIWIRLRSLLKKLGPLSYVNNTEAKIDFEVLKSHHIPMGTDWKLLVKYHKIILPQQVPAT